MRQPMPFIDRNPTPAEEQLLQILLSSFSDGTGWEREPDGTTRVGWRQMERVFAYFYTGDIHKEDKDIFDISSPRWGEPNTIVGVSVKSKELGGRKQIFGDGGDNRLYLELANSPSKFWRAIADERGLYESDYREKKHPDRIGNTVLELVRRWHLEGGAKLENEGYNFDAEASCYLTISYSKPNLDGVRRCQVHSHSLDLPEADWEFTSEKCLRGHATIGGEQVYVYDWYGLSGGQLKYYPPESTSNFASRKFELLKTPKEDFLEKSITLFPDFRGLEERLVECQRRLFI